MTKIIVVVLIDTESHIIKMLIVVLFFVPFTAMRKERIEGKTKLKQADWIVFMELLIIIQSFTVTCCPNDIFRRFKCVLFWYYYCPRHSVSKSIECFHHFGKLM
jgi:hypothetical protein